MGDEANGFLEVGDELGVGVEVGLFGPHHRVLVSVKRLPEGSRVDPPLAKLVVTRAGQTVPEDLGLTVRELTAEAIADPVEHLAGVGPVDVDQRAVEIEQPKVILGDHSDTTVRPS